MSHPGGLSLVQCFAYWTDCAIATYETSVSYSTFSVSEQNRYHSIAVGMLEDLKAATLGQDATLTAETMKNWLACSKRLEEAEITLALRIRERQNKKT